MAGGLKSCVQKDAYLSLKSRSQYLQYLQIPGETEAPGTYKWRMEMLGTKITIK